MSRVSSILFVDRNILEQVEKRFEAVLRDAQVSSLLLIDRTGAVIACSGDLPLPPDQMGATTATIFLAMSALIRAARTQEFIVHMPSNNMNLQFHEVDSRLFLCAFYVDPRDEKSVREVMQDLADEARNMLADNPVNERRTANVEFIGEKLNELFERPT